MNNSFFKLASVLNRSNRPALWLNIGLALGAVLLVNGGIAALDWDRQSTGPAQAKSPFAVPGAVVGSVWTLLFVGMGAARWRLNRSGSARTARWWVSVLLVNCGLYPAYTLGLQSLYLGLAGNLLTIALALRATRLAWPRDRLAAWLVSPVVGWVLFASYLIVGQLGWLNH